MTRLPLRLRFACLTAAVILTGGAAVLALNYLLLREHLGPSLERVPLDALVVQPADGVQPAAGRAAGTSSAGPAPPPASPSPRDGTATVLTVQRDLERAALRAVLVQSGVALAATAAAGLLAAWALAGRYLRPIRLLSAAVREVSETTLHRRIGSTGARDEISDVAASVDGMLDRLQAAFEAQRRFAANASHELRTPLAVSRTAAEVLARKARPTTAEVRGAAATIVSATDRSERVLAALLALARAQRGIEVHDEQALHVLVEQALREREVAARQRRLTVRVALSQAGVAGDRALLEVLVRNLLDNAVSYSAPGGVVEVSTTTAQQQVVLTVSNSGERLPADAATWLFAPFRRGPGAERTGRGGSGLGLALVDAVARAHGGTATGQPLPAGGLRVTVTLPAAGTRGAQDRCPDQVRA